MIKQVNKLQGIIMIVLTIVYIISTLFMILFPNFDYFDYLFILFIYIGSMVSIFYSLLVGFILVLFFLLFIGGYIIYEFYFGHINNIGFKYLYIILLPFFSLIAGILRKQIHLIRKGIEPIEKDAENLVRIDKLTGFRNAKDFYLTLDEEMKRALRYGADLSIAIIELSYFEEFSAMNTQKNIADTFIAISKLISDVTRIVDKPYRITTSMFAVILPNTNQESAKVVKKRLKEAVLKNNISDKPENINYELKIGVLEYKEEYENSIIYKKACEMEIEYDN